MDHRRLQIMLESRNAPGLPRLSKPRGNAKSHGNSRYLEVSSINYGYLPMNLDSPKVFWIDLTSPAPPDLLVGTPARLHISPGTGIQTTLSKNNPDNSLFEVDDIVGSRVILNPYKNSAWLPTVHESCSDPFGWGYDMKRTNVSPSMHNVKYGYGVPIASLEYTPVYYSERATRYDAHREEEDWYLGRRWTPGW